MKTEFPFGEFDFRKYMGDFKLTGMDSKGMMEQQKRNIEAIQEANQQAMQNMQKIMQRQTEMVQEAMQEASGDMKDMMSAGTPEDGARKQTEIVQRAFEHTIANIREIAEMTAKSNRDIFDLLNSRMMANIEEVRPMSGNAAAGGKPKSEGAKPAEPKK